MEPRAAGDLAAEIHEHKLAVADCGRKVFVKL